MITEYQYDLSDLRNQFAQWMNEGNVIKVNDNKYNEQTTQWRRAFTLSELKHFFIQEYFLGEVSPLDIILFKINHEL